MPRIAAALAVLLTAVTCIGFNTARYPAVWQMLALADGMPPSDQSDDPAASLQSVAASQSEELTPALAIAESSSGWSSDRQSEEGRFDSTDWEAPIAKPSSPHASHDNQNEEEEQQQHSKKKRKPKKKEEENSHRDSGEDSSPRSQEDGYRDSDDRPDESDAGPRDTETASSSGFGQDQWAGAHHDRAHAGDQDEAADGGDDASCGYREERPKRVANRESRGQTASEPEANLSPSRRDPVAPADDPVEAPTSARYASYALGTPGDGRDTAPGDAPAPREAEEAGQPVPKSTLVPVKPATTGPDGDQALAARPGGDARSLRRGPGSSGTSQVIPLPPVDEVSALAAPPARPPGAVDAIRIYPTTGME